MNTGDEAGALRAPQGYFFIQPTPGSRPGLHSFARFAGWRYAGCSALAPRGEKASEEAGALRAPQGIPLLQPTPGSRPGLNSCRPLCGLGLCGLQAGGSRLK